MDCQTSTGLAPNPRYQYAKSKPTQQQKRAVRACYVTGQGTVAWCARKHQVNEDTAYGWSDDEDWAELRTAFDEREAQRLVERTLPATPEPKPEPIRAGLTPDQNQKLSQVEDQLSQIDRAIAEADQRSLPGLWKAKSMALDAWSLLTGFPRPGVRKQSRPSRSMPDLQPVVSSPEPVQARLQHDPNEPNG
jgi:transposase-like protein